MVYPTADGSGGGHFLLALFGGVCAGIGASDVYDSDEHAVYWLSGDSGRGIVDR